MQVNSLIVNNYRCIGKIELDRLSPITVLVGRNNTGKSALLEAFALASTAESGWFDALGTDLLGAIVRRRGGWNFANMMIKIGKHKSEIHVTGKNIGGNVVITSKIEDLPDDARANIITIIGDYVDSGIKSYRDRLVRTRPRSSREISTLEERMMHVSSRMKNDVLRQAEAYITYNDKLHERSEYAALLGEQSLASLRLREYPEEIPLDAFFPRTEVIRSSPPRRSEIIFMLTPSPQYLGELQRRLARSGELIKLIKNMRKRISYFEDIREVENQFLVFIKGLQRPVPLGSMGDGFSAQLAILAAIANVRDGFFLMEEPEIRLHPGYMSSIADQIAETAARREAQYIISTHSSDFLDFILRAASELLKVVRMYRIEDTAEIDYELLDGKEALEEIKELKMDLRGI